MDKINVWLENKCSLQFCIQDLKEGGRKFLKSSRALVRRNCQIITLLSKLTQHGELGAFRVPFCACINSGISRGGRRGSCRRKFLLSWSRWWCKNLAEVWLWHTVTKNSIIEWVSSWDFEGNHTTSKNKKIYVPTIPKHIQKLPPMLNHCSFRQTCAQKLGQCT